MTKYRLYKPAKFKWLDNIPEHWGEGRISYFFEIGRGRVISELELNPDGIYPVYSSQTKNDGCLGYIDTYDFEGNILTWTTDGANAGSVFIRRGKFNCTNVCGTLTPRIDLHLKYYLYYLQVITPFYKRPDTNGAKIMNNEMAQIYCLMPPLNEQKIIADYLDYQLDIIDRIIQEKQELLGLLQEEVQSYINELVTKGLPGAKKLKETNVDWVGEIPEAWEYVKLKYLLSKEPYSLKTGPFGSQLTSNELVEEGAFAIYNQRNVLDNQFLDFKDYVTEEKALTLKGFEVYPEDILVTTRGTIGKAAIVPKSAPKGFLHPCLIAVRLDTTKVLPSWLLLYMNASTIFINDVLYQSNSTTIEVIYGQTLKEVHIPLPPSLEEQQQIIDASENRLNQVTTMVNEIKGSIDLLKEYRQSIIMEAVMGVVDLSTWKTNTKKKFV